MKILYFIRALNIGGAETFIYNTLSAIDDEYHIDFVLQSYRNNNERLLELCKKKNSALYYITPFYKNYLKSVRELKIILKKENYDIIHIHANALINMVPIIAARKIKVKIALHSHNTKNNLGGVIGHNLHKLNRFYTNRLDILRFACSEEAGKWMYGNNTFTILNNAIDIEAYKFDLVARRELRESLGVKDKFVIGHVSRFVEAKNHNFLIEIFNEILKINANSELILIGEGELVNNIKDKCKELGIVDKVNFVGAVQNPARYYSAFDCMIFPSLFEGLPFTLVEAQASGLPIFASNNITKEVNITGNINYIGLENSAKCWANIIINYKKYADRTQIYLKLKNSIFDEKVEVDKIQRCYKSYRK